MQRRLVRGSERSTLKEMEDRGVANATFDEKEVY
jgi:hypothetical protein